MSTELEDHLTIRTSIMVSFGMPGDISISK